jgi:hypothetical protein
MRLRNLTTPLGLVATLAALVALVFAALSFAEVARAEEGWTVAKRQTVSARWQTSAYVYGSGEAARLTVRAPKGLVRVTVWADCTSDDYVTTVRREYRWRLLSRGVRRPIVKLLPVTLAHADCSFAAMLSGNAGTMRVLLEVREHVRPEPSW